MFKNEQNEFGQKVGFSVHNWSARSLPSKEKIIGNYCTLELLNIEKHGNKLFESFQFEDQGESWTYLSFGPFYNYEEFKEWLIKINSDRILYIIIDSVHNLPVGTASYQDINLDHGVIEVGAVKYSKLLQKSRKRNNRSRFIKESKYAILN